MKVYRIQIKKVKKLKLWGAISAKRNVTLQIFEENLNTTYI